MKLTHERLLELLTYESKSGVFTWKKSRKGVTEKTIAGCQEKSGYQCIKIDYTKYMLHRVAWFYVYGNWPKLQIDHIDGNKSNNSIANLREATPSENAQNQYKGRGISNLLGAHWDKKIGRWRSYIRINNNQKYLGIFDTPESAHIAYMNAKREFHPFNQL